MWTFNLYIFVCWLLYMQFITSPQWKYINAFRLELKWLSYLYFYSSLICYGHYYWYYQGINNFIWILSTPIPGRHYAASPHCVLKCYPTWPKVDLTNIWEGGNCEPRCRLALPTWLRLAPVLGPNAERARGGPQTSLVNIVQPRGCIFEAGNSFTTQSNLNSNLVKMQIARLFWCWYYQESQ